MVGSFGIVVLVVADAAQVASRTIVDLLALPLSGARS
jgi:hypothetical protein